MNTMTYKGQTARIDFDDADGIFIGRLVGTSLNQWATKMLGEAARSAHA
jgi:hypothetical protein